MIDSSKLREISQYLKIDLLELRKKDLGLRKLPGRLKWIHLSVADWNRSVIDQSNKNQVESWFRTTQSYIYELMEVASQNAKKRLIKYVLDFCKRNKINSILDYGCGIGELVIKAEKRGFTATAADLPSETLNFAKWRFREHKVSPRVIEIKGSGSLRNKYGAIVCFEVLQHVYNPIETAKHLAEHLKTGGYLFITTRFVNPKYPLALKANVRFDEGMVKFFTNHGLQLIRKIYQYGKGRKAKYLYIYQRP